MDSIISKLKKTNRYFWFIYKDNRFSLMSQAMSKSEAKDSFLEKDHDFKDIPIILVYIKIEKNLDGPLIGGPICIVIQFKRIGKNNKIKSAKNDTKSGVVWFSKDYLVEHGFKSEYLLKILEAIYFDKIKLNVIGNTMYEHLDL
ncbi:hypothetical protein CPAV1605_157 [seawater metagenome]|uniref:Uncharacterized protein n=1 Tax=seawater metagenome TaxID=1561972 RepID=A0A5E8CKV6_9ZZZZ